MDVPFRSITLKTTIVSSPTSVDPYLQELQALAEIREKVIAMHVQYYRENANSETKPALLVLSVDTRVIIFQLHYLSGNPESLFKSFLHDSQLKFAGYKMQENEQYELSCGQNFEISKYAAIFHPDLKQNEVGFVGLVREVLGVVIADDSVLRRSKLDAAVLTREQVEYVSVVAYLSYRIYWKLNITMKIKCVIM